MRWGLHVTLPRLNNDLLMFALSTIRTPLLPVALLSCMGITQVSGDGDVSHGGIGEGSPRCQWGGCLAASQVDQVQLALVLAVGMSHLCEGGERGACEGGSDASCCTGSRPAVPTLMASTAWLRLEPAFCAVEAVLRLLRACS